MEKLARSTNNFTGIFKGSLEQAFAFDNAEDVEVVNVANTYEIQDIIAIMPGGGLYDLGRTYLLINTPAGAGFYVWFDIDNKFADPAVAQAEIRTVTIEGTATPALLDGDYFEVENNSNVYWFWFDVDNLSTPPVPGGSEILVEIDIATGNSPTDIAMAAQVIVNGHADFVSTRNGTELEVVNVTTGPANDANNGTCGVDVTVVTIVDGDAIDAGVSGKTGLEANLFTGDTIAEIADAIETTVDANVNFACTSDNIDTATIVNKSPGPVTNASDGAGAYATGFTIPAPTIDGANNYKTYTRLAPGIAFLNGLMLVSTPQLYIAERQLIKAFNLRISDTSGENVVINYNFATDKYSVVISKLDSNDALQVYTFNNGGSGYDTGFEMIIDIYNHPVFNATMVAAIGTDLTKIILEPIVEITANNTYYWSLMNTGDIELRTSSGDYDIHDFIVSDYTIPTIGTTNDTRTFFQNFNDFDKNIYLNVPDTWDDPTDPTNTTKTLSDDLTKQFNPIDNTSVDYTKVVDKSCMITILRQHDGANYNSTSANFGWVEGDVADLDPHGIPPSSSGGPKDIFFANKDLVIQWGILSSEWARFSDLALSIGGTVPSVATYTNLPPSGPDGEIYLVRDVNQLFRYASALSTWIPISDPHKQFWAQTGSMLGNLADDWTGLVGRRYIFSGIWWKTDGSNLQVFMNGIFQLLGIDYNLGGTGTAEQNSLTFTYDLIATDRAIVRVSEGGDEFYPEKVNYTVGIAGGAYIGSLINFPVYWEPVRDKVDVFVNGILNRDSPFVKALTETTGSLTDRIVDTGVIFSAANIGNWILVVSATNADNVWEIRRVVSVPNATTLVLDAVLPQNTTIGDGYQLFKDYDYFVDEYTNTIIFANDQVDSDFVEIRDRATIVGTLNLTNKGTTFPTTPIFGMEFFKTDEGVSGEWFKYSVEAGWQQIT